LHVASAVWFCLGPCNFRISQQIGTLFAHLVIRHQIIELGLHQFLERRSQDVLVQCLHDIREQPQPNEQQNLKTTVATADHCSASLRGSFEL
jgi:hypothetical protein